MSLCQPSVIGTLSELSTSNVQGQMVGARVTILSISAQPRVIVEGIATSSNQQFSLLNGVQLSNQDLLIVLQELNGEQSEAPAGGLEVGV